MVRGGWASIRVHHKKLRIFSADLSVDFKITIMSTGDQRGWFNSDEICGFDGGFDVSIKLRQGGNMVREAWHQLHCEKTDFSDLPFLFIL